jgi:hypothetical protein
LVNASPSVEDSTIGAARTLLSHAVGAVKVHALGTVWGVLLRNASEAIEDKSSLAIRTSVRNTVLPIERASGWAVWWDGRSAVVTVAVGTRLAPRKIRVLAIPTNEC